MQHIFVIYCCDFKTGKREPAAFLFDSNLNIADKKARQMEAELAPVLRKSIVFVAKPCTRAFFEGYLTEHELKRCADCATYKHYPQFFSERFHKHGLTPYCKPCHLKRSAGWKERNKEHVEADRRRTNANYSRAVEMAGLTHRGFRALPQSERLAWIAKARGSKG